MSVIPDYADYVSKGIDSVNTTGLGLTKTGTSKNIILQNTGVVSLNSLSGAVSLTAGTNIELIPVGNNLIINQINGPILNRASGTTPLLITATTSGTAQTIGNLSLTTSAIYDIDISAVVVFQTTSNTQIDVNLYITVDGLQVGQIFTSTINGINHYLSFPIQVSALNASLGSHTILLKCFAGTASIITARSYQLRGIGNLA
jgi:hypothetical protein